jgi:hypothetical protein
MHLGLRRKRGQETFMRTIGFIGLCVGITGTLLACSSSSSPAGSADTGVGHDANDNKGDSGTPHGDSGKPSKDAGHSDGGGTNMDASNVDAGGVDSGHDSMGTPMVDAGKDAAPLGPQQLLITYGGATSGTSETVVVAVATKAVGGHIDFAGSGFTDTRNSTSPFLLESTANVVAKLDPVKPWLVDSTWNVALTDGADGGTYTVDPYQVIIETGTAAYVLRYDRNDIAVINESMNVDGGAPTSTISLAGLLETGDSDGVVEMTAGAYVASTNRLYVVLANVDQNVDATYNGVICGSLTSVVTAIDTQTNAVVSLGGTGPKGSVPLTYYNPTDVVYDTAGGRLLIVSEGCYAKPASVGAPLGASSQVGVEAFDLATAKATSLLPITASEFPTGFVDVPTGFAYIDSTHAVIGFDSSGANVYNWNPTTTTLGSLIPNAPDVFTYDGNGHLLGTRADTPDGGTVSTTDVVSVVVATGVSTTLATNLSSLSPSYVESVDVWPHP